LAVAGACICTSCRRLLLLRCFVFHRSIIDGGIPIVLAAAGRHAASARRRRVSSRTESWRACSTARRRVLASFVTRRQPLCGGCLPFRRCDTGCGAHEL
jgi:hypothetical protein